MRIGLRLSLLFLLATAGCDHAGTPTASPSTPGSVPAAAEAAADRSSTTATADQQASRPPAVENTEAVSPESADEQARGAAAMKSAAAASSGEHPAQQQGEQPPDKADDPQARSSLTANGDSERHDAAPPGPAYSTFDLLTPTTVAPLVLRLRIAIDGEPLEDFYARELSQLQTRLDADADGTLRWQELVADSHMIDLLTGGQNEQTMMMQRNAAGRYDLNRNQTVEADELQRVLASGSAQYGSFDLDAQANYRHSNRTESNVLRVVDADRDARLDDSEIRTAGRALQAYDANADGLVRLDELAPATRPMMGRMARRTGAAFGEAALELNDASDWSLIGDALRWWPGVSDGPFGDFTAGLDTNGDGWFYPDEARGIQQRQPHLTATIEFTRTGADNRWQSEVSIESSDALCTDITPCEREEGRFVLQTPQLTWTLELPAGGLIETGNSQEPLQMGQVQVTAGEQPDVLFGILDADSDGGLSGRELREAAARLRRLDGDANRSVDTAELPDAYLVSLRWRGARPAAAPEPAAAGVAIPSWARFLDLNRDGEIERSEFPGTDAQFLRLDADSDGYATLAEAAQVEAADNDGDDGSDR